MRILLAGNQNLTDFFALYLTNNQISYNIYTDYKNSVKKDPKFDIIILFSKTDIHSAEDELKEINIEFSNKIPSAIILEDKKFNIIDSFFKLGAKYIFFDFKPETIVEEVKKVIQTEEYLKKAAPSKNDYLINFYENNGAFIIDISGLFTPERIKPLKLMFTNYLKEKIPNLKVIIYVFSNTDEKSFNFINIWTLFRIWQELKINFVKVTYLTTSENIKNEIEKFFKPFGVIPSENLLEIAKRFYPELANKDEETLFDFSSKLLLQPPAKNSK